jgi:hypothetical protein
VLRLSHAAGGIIGQVCILQFACEGVRRLAGLDLSLNGLKNTESLLLKEFPDAQFLSLQANLAIEEEVDQAFKEVLRVFGARITRSTMQQSPALSDRLLKTPWVIWIGSFPST